MQPQAFEYAELRRELCEAARQSFSALREAHSDERFYAFALYSDDGVMTACPAANTEEGLQRTRNMYRGSVTDEQDYLRWGTGEWAYEGVEAGCFDRACEMLLAVSADDFDEDEFNSHRMLVFEQMIAALDDLQTEGFFGAGDDRRAVTLFCTTIDSFDARELELESARRLNGSLPASPYWR